MQQLPELLLIDKPEEISSFDVIRQLRTQTGIRKFGHAGTLDPAASGLLLIGVERGTKLLTELIKLDKEYVTTICLGVSTTTGDREGEVVETKVVDEAAEILRSKISAALTDMTGTLTLPVSAYSAIKKDGVPMYKRARAAAAKDEEVTEVPLRAMEVYETELIQFHLCIIDDTQQGIATVRFKVGSGTYIRSLGEELGRRLGYPAHLTALRRTQIGEYRIEDAQQIEEIRLNE